MNSDIPCANKHHVFSIIIQEIEMFRIQTIDGVIFNGPLESLILSEEVKRLEKSYTARKIIDRKTSDGRKEDTDKNYSHAVKAYKDAVNINQEIEPILHAYTIMKSPVLSLDPGMNIVDAWNLFQSKGISHMPVLSEDKRIIGIVSDMAEDTNRIADLLRLHDQGQSIRQCRDFRMYIRSRNGKLIQLLCPGGKADRCVVGRCQRFGFAE